MRFYCTMISALIAFFVSACGGQGTASNGGVSTPKGPPDTSLGDPKNPTGADVSGNPTSGSNGHVYSIDVLLFNGVGISTSDWQSTEQIVKSAGLSYQLVNSAQLNAMTLDQMASFGLMIFPGGYGNQISDGLDSDTRIRVRQAVRDRGVSFLGICAGAWVTVGPDPGTSAAPYGFAVATGSILTEYLPNGQEPTAAMVDVSFADGSGRYLVWWGGPITPAWQNGVVARYVTGDPAISETWAGKGFVIVSGPHPEAPQGWRATAGNDPDGLDFDIATRLIKAALSQQPLPAF